MAAMNVEAMKARSSVLGATREFFLSRGYLETDTPALAPALIPESCLEVFKTEYVNPFLGRLELYLVPSPEVWMKPILARTRESLFQVCKCFRNAESLGRVHSPEFTMLEYYTVGAEAEDSIAITEELFDACALPETPSWARPPFARMTMEEAFKEFARVDLAALAEDEAMREAARSKGLMVADDESWEDAFNKVFLTFVEPELPDEDRPLVLEKYPARIECLAANVPGTMWKDRWELYARGVELANCYTEAADPGAVRASFEREGPKKAAMAVPHRIDYGYPDLFADFPRCSGVAMGFDRFVMTLSGLSRFEDMLPFRFEDTLAKFPPVKG
jgi:lysyl-tRNA synthetase class 2